MKRILAILSVAAITCLGLCFSGVTLAKPNNTRIVALKATEEKLGVKLSTGEWWIYDKNSIHKGLPRWSTGFKEREYFGGGGDEYYENGSKKTVPGKPTMKTVSPYGNLGVTSSGHVYCTRTSQNTSLGQYYENQPDGSHFGAAPLTGHPCPYRSWGEIYPLQNKGIKYVASTIMGSYYAASDTHVYAWGENYYGAFGQPSEVANFNSEKNKPYMILGYGGKNSSELVGVHYGGSNDTIMKRGGKTANTALIGEDDDPYNWTDMFDQNNKNYVGVNNVLEGRENIFFTNENGTLKVNAKTLEGINQKRNLAFLSGETGEFKERENRTPSGKPITKSMTVSGLPDTTGLEQLYYTDTMALAVISGRTYIWGAYYDGGHQGRKNQIFTDSSTPSCTETSCAYAHGPEDITNRIGGSKPVPGALDWSWENIDGVYGWDISFATVNGYEYLFSHSKHLDRRMLGDGYTVKPIKEIGTYQDKGNSLYGVWEDGEGFKKFGKNHNLVTFHSPDGDRFKRCGGYGGYVTEGGKIYRDTNFGQYANLEKATPPPPFKDANLTYFAPRGIDSGGVWFYRNTNDGESIIYNWDSPSNMESPDFQGARVRGSAARINTPKDLTPAGGFPSRYVDSSAYKIGSLESRCDNDSCGFQLGVSLDEYQLGEFKPWDSFVRVGNKTKGALDSVHIEVDRGGKLVGSDSTLLSLIRPDKYDYSQSASIGGNLFKNETPTQEAYNMKAYVYTGLDSCKNGSCQVSYTLGSPKISSVKVKPGGQNHGVSFSLSPKQAGSSLASPVVKVLKGDNVASVNAGSAGLLRWDSSRDQWDLPGWASVSAISASQDFSVDVRLLDKSKPGSIQLVAADASHRFTAPASASSGKLGECPTGADWCKTVTIEPKRETPDKLGLSLAPVSVDAGGVTVMRLTAKNDTEFTTPPFAMRGGDDLSVENMQEGDTAESKLTGTVWMPEVPGGETRTVDLKVRLKNEDKPGPWTVRLHKIDGQKVDDKVTVETKILVPEFEVLPFGDLTAPKWKIRVKNPSGAGKVTVSGGGVKFADGSQEWKPSLAGVPDAPKPASAAGGLTAGGGGETLGAGGSQVTPPVVKIDQNTVETILTAPPSTGTVTIPVVFLEPFTPKTVDAVLSDGSKIVSTVTPLGVSKDGKALFKVEARNTSQVSSPGRVYTPSLSGYTGKLVYAKTVEGLDLANPGVIEVKDSVDVWETGVLKPGETKTTLLVVERGKTDAVGDVVLTLAPKGKQCVSGGEDSASGVSGSECGVLHVGSVQPVLEPPDVLPAPGVEAEWTLKLKNMSDLGAATHVKVQSLEADSGLENPVFLPQEGVVVSGDGKTVTIPVVDGGVAINIKLKAKVKPGVNLQDGVTHSVLVESLLSKPLTSTGRGRDESVLQVDVASGGVEAPRVGVEFVWVVRVKNPGVKPVAGVQVDFGVEGISGFRIDTGVDTGVKPGTGVDTGVKPDTTWKVGNLAAKGTKTIKIRGTLTETGPYTIQAKAHSALLPTPNACKPNQNIDQDDDRCDLYTIQLDNKTRILLTPPTNTKAGQDAVFQAEIQAPAAGIKTLTLTTDKGKWGQEKTTGSFKNNQWTIGPVKPGETIKNTITVPTSPDDTQISIKVGTKPNINCKPNPDLSSDDDTCDTKTATLKSSAELKVESKLAKGENAYAGETVEWKITIHNTGQSTARNLKGVLVNTKNMENAVITPNGNSGNKKTWTLDKLEAGTKTEITVNLTTPKNASMLEGAFNLTAEPGLASTTSMKTTLTVPEKIPPIELRKTWAGVSEDGKDLWKITATNTHPKKRPVKRLVLIDTAQDSQWGNLPADTTMSVDGNQLVIPEIAADRSVEVTAATSGTQTNTVWATSQGADRETPPSGCGKQPACATATRPSPTPKNVKIEKHYLKSDGDKDWWQITVKNTSDTPTENITIIDQALNLEWGVQSGGAKPEGDRWNIPLLKKGSPATVTLASQQADSNMAWAVTTGMERETPTVEACVKDPTCALAESKRPPAPPAPSKDLLDELRVEKTHLDTTPDGREQWQIRVIYIGSGAAGRFTVVDRAGNVEWGNPTEGEIAGDRWKIDGLAADSVASVNVTTRGIVENLAWVEKPGEPRKINTVEECEASKACVVSRKSKPEKPNPGLVLDSIRVEKTYQSTVGGRDEWRVTVTNTGSKPVEGLAAVDWVRSSRWEGSPAGGETGNRRVLPRLDAGRSFDSTVATRGVDVNLVWVEFVDKPRSVSGVADCRVACATARKVKKEPSDSAPTPSETATPTVPSSGDIDTWDNVVLEATGGSKADSDGKTLSWGLKVRNTSSKPVNSVTVNTVMPLNNLRLEVTGGVLVQDATAISDSKLVAGTGGGGVAAATDRASSLINTGVASADSASTRLLDFGGAGFNGSEPGVAVETVPADGGQTQATISTISPGGTVTLSLSGQRRDSNPVQGAAWVTRKTGNRLDKCFEGKCVYLTADGEHRQQPDSSQHRSEPQPSQSPVAPSGMGIAGGSQPSQSPVAPSGMGVAGVPQPFFGGWGGGLAVTGSVVRALAPWVVFMLLAGLLLLAGVKRVKNRQK